MTRIMIGIVIVAALGGTQQSDKQHIMVTPDQIQWMDGPEGLPPGVKFAVIEGDPKVPGALFTIRAKMPANLVRSAVSGLPKRTAVGDAASPFRGETMTIRPDSPAPPIETLVPGTGELRATFKTSMGDITVKLYEKEAPRTVANFVALATGQVEWTDPATGQKTNRPLYSGTQFHRVIPEFVVQGGGPTPFSGLTSTSPVTRIRLCGRYRTVEPVASPVTVMSRSSRRPLQKVIWSR